MRNFFVFQRFMEPFLNPDATTFVKRSTEEKLQQKVSNFFGQISVFHIRNGKLMVMAESIYIISKNETFTFI